jgi:hypothetical protein
MGFTGPLAHPCLNLSLGVVATRPANTFPADETGVQGETIFGAEISHNAQYPRYKWKPIARSRSTGEIRYVLAEKQPRRIATTMERPSR